MENKALLGNIHSSGQLLLTLGMALFILMITAFAAALLAIPFVDRGIFQLFESLDPMVSDDMNLLRYLQIISHIGMFIIPSFLLAWLFGRKILAYLYLDNMPGGKMLFMSVLLIFVAVPLINYIMELNAQMHFPESLRGVEDWMRRYEETAERTTIAFLSVDTLSGLLFNIFMVAVIPAIGEELMFRGVLLRIFNRWTGSYHWGVLITAIIFSAIHMQFFGFFPRFLLGLLFGYLVVWSGSLWPAIIAHFINNAAAVTFFYLFQHQLSDGTFENLGKGNEGMVYALISLVLVFFVMWWVRRHGKPVKDLQAL
ncbi:MAG: CPBP family intramembrane metalloprotease [Bacteroidetes bacterium]|nr:MAG: CPBP family intramembrane metalloprotease [Bacteroidota bacterium]